MIHTGIRSRGSYKPRTIQVETQQRALLVFDMAGKTLRGGPLRPDQSAGQLETSCHDYRWDQLASIALKRLAVAETISKDAVTTISAQPYTWEQVIDAD